MIFRLSTNDSVASLSAAAECCFAVPLFKHYTCAPLRRHAVALCAAQRQAATAQALVLARHVDVGGGGEVPELWKQRLLVSGNFQHGCSIFIW